MRVISGWLGGRNFDAPPGHRTHPMGTKIRGGLFGVLGDIEGLTVLDAFAGSGALAIEAISRGAASAVAIDADKKAYRTLKENIEVLGLEDRIQTVHAYCASWSTRHLAQQFDLIFLDPPFDDIVYNDMPKLARHLAPDGTVVVNWPGRDDRPPVFPGLKIVKRKDYGDAQLVFYQ